MTNWLVADGLFNGRDLGGLPRRDGTLTPTGRFYRSASVDSVTPRGWKQIRAAGITSVIDLRQPGERTEDTGPRPPWLQTVALDLDGLDNTRFWDGYWSNGLAGTSLYYLPHLAAMPERTVAVLSALAAARPGGVLFHCQGGRDRTGLIAMALLTLADVEHDAIIDDYLATVRLGLDPSTAIPRIDEAVAEARCTEQGTSTAQAFRDALVGFDPAPLLSALTPTARRALKTWQSPIT